VAAKELPGALYALRHSHASVLIRKGVDILTISRRLGHHKPNVTLDVYGHLISGADKAAADAIAGGSEMSLPVAIGLQFPICCHKNWSERGDLNSRPPVPQTGALTELRYAPT
jgi:hypothetical protein